MHIDIRMTSKRAEGEKIVSPEMEWGVDVLIRTSMAWWTGREQVFAGPASRILPRGCHGVLFPRGDNGMAESELACLSSIKPWGPMNNARNVERIYHPLTALETTSLNATSGPDAGAGQ